MSDIALTVSVLALVAVVGLWIGNIKVRGVGFGIGGVLFGGIIVGHFVDQAGVTLSGDMLHFIQEFGLILFVYTIGIQVGPGFFASLRVSGLRLNLFAVLIVIMGGLVTAILHKIFAIPLPVVLGIFSGAVTNTPALGAGQQILRDLGTPVDLVDQMGMSYAMAYPFGICGILLTMWLMRLIFRVNVEAEAQKHESSLANGHSLIQTMNIRVENPNLNNMAIQDVPILNSDKIICSRLKRDDTLMVPSPGTIIQAGDLLHLVGQSTDLHNAQLVIARKWTPRCRRAARIYASSVWSSPTKKCSANVSAICTLKSVMTWLSPALTARALSWSPAATLACSLATFSIWWGVLPRLMR